MTRWAWLVTWTIAALGCGRVQYELGPAPGIDASDAASDGSSDSALDEDVMDAAFDADERDVAMDAIEILDGDATNESDARDAEIDVGMDAEVDAGVDAEVDAGVDAEVDAGVDAEVDAGVDAEVDTGVDAEVDTGIDAGPPPSVVVPIYPWNGVATGSVHALPSGVLTDEPRRPRFMWLPAAGATYYEVQIDDSCPVSGFVGCAFPSPEAEGATSATTYRPSALAVSLIAPVGRRYYWRVRACNAAACSAYAEPRYLDVGRQSSDFDGDGYADVAIGAQYRSNPEANEGNAYVHYGSSSGLGAAPDLTLDNPADQAGGAFGSLLEVAGDVNADGFADLLVGAYNQSNPEANEGNVFLYYGSASGLAADPDLTFDNPVDEASASFGTVAGPGDLNGDGYADIVVGAATANGVASDEGAVYVYDGGASGPSPTPSFTLPHPKHSANAYFGARIGSPGDLNGDGLPDLVVGAWNQANFEVGEGNAFVYYGARLGLTIAADAVLDNPANQTNAGFGRALAGIGDCNRDGYADLIVAAFYGDGPEVDEGNAYLYYGSATGVALTPDATLDNPDDEAQGFFGRSIGGGGDLDGDGYTDVVIGANGQDSPESGEGNAFVYFGGPDGLGVESPVVLDNPTDAVFGLFGGAVAPLRDLDGDGFADMIIGAYSQSNPESSEGNVFVYEGRPSRVFAAPDLSIDSPSGQASAEFGGWIALVRFAPTARSRYEGRRWRSAERRRATSL